MAGLYEGDTDEVRVTATVDRQLVGANLEAHLTALRKQMYEAAENLEFEEAARLRDEVKRLETVELEIADDPFARQSAIAAAGRGINRAAGSFDLGKARFVRREETEAPLASRCRGESPRDQFRGFLDAVQRNEAAESRPLA